MSKANSVICIIPARLASTRLPRKMLADLGGKPLLQWAYEGAKNCEYFSDVIVAVDHLELLDAVTNFGGKAILTAPTCQTGTDRLCELVKREICDGDVFVNWQGDEPFITPSAIKTLLQSMDNQEEEIWTLMRKIEDPEEIASEHIVKVVTNQNGKALYFSRSPIPHGSKKAYQHIGLYAYRKKALQKISTLSICALENQERLEQLRFLYHGLPIRVHETREKIFGIDTKEELAIANRLCYTH